MWILLVLMCYWYQNKVAFLKDEKGTKFSEMPENLTLFVMDELKL